MQSGNIPAMNARPNKMLCRRLALLVLLVGLYLLPSFALAAQKPCLSTKSTEALENWMKGIAGEKDFSLSVSQYKAACTIGDVSFLLVHVSTEEKELAAFGESKLVADKLPPQLLSAILRNPPPAIWKFCGAPSPEPESELDLAVVPVNGENQPTEEKALNVVPKSLPDAVRTEPPASSEMPKPEPWRWLLIPLALAPVFWLGIWLIGWWRRLPKQKASALYRFGLVAGLGLFILLQTVALDDYSFFEWGSKTDYAAGLVMARGIEAPVRGQNLSGGAVYSGPLYYILLGLTALVSESPRFFGLLTALSQVIALGIGAAFLRRAFGPLAAALFAVFWGGLYLNPLEITTPDHSFLAFPIVALAAWLMWEMARNRDGRLLAPLVLVCGLAFQLYGIYAALFTSLALVFVLYRIHPSLRDWLLATLAFLLTQGFTFALSVWDWFHGIGMVMVEEIRGESFSVLAVLQYLWGCFAGAFPLYGLTFSLVVLVAILLGIWRAVRGKDRAATGWRVLWLMLLPPIFALAIFHQRFETWYAVAILPLAPMLSAAAVARLGGDRLERIVSNHPILLGVVLLIVVAMLAVVRDPGAQKYRNKTRPPLRDQMAITASLRQIGVKSVSDLDRHLRGEWAHQGYKFALDVLLAALSGEASGSLQDKEIWLTKDPLPILEPTASVVVPKTRFVPFRLVSYMSQLDYDHAVIRIGENAGKRFRNKFQLPYHEINRRRPVKFLIGNSAIRTNEKLIPDTTIAENSLQIDIPTRSAFTRPLVIFISKCCDVTVLADGQKLEGTDKSSSSEATVSQRVFVPPITASGIQVTLDLSSCWLEEFDIMDPPIIIPRPH